ncbi:hypothetical protein BRADI_2g15976v3 [Brachypodium distachyon]|uniref:Uncharacterized protein n=1 Tax=Brachypodium distachyon TaxID=15368 RepID=A0A2K2D8T5_BRADI|nr:hypothetical protein BRADI_2g15976v3 [Brachypodium distachyon]
MAREECLEPVAPLIRDFPLHLQPYAHALIKSKLEESKYYVAVNQIRLHEQFDEFLASSKLDCDVYRFMFSKVTLPVQIDEDCMEVVVNKVPSKFWELEPALRKLSFERRADIVQVETEIYTYLECLQGLFASEEVRIQQLIRCFTACSSGSYSFICPFFLLRF